MAPPFLPVRPRKGKEHLKPQAPGLQAGPGRWLWAHTGSDNRCQTPLAQGLCDFSQREAPPEPTPKTLLGWSEDVRNTPGGQNSGAEGHSWAQLPGLWLQSLPLACQSFHDEIKSENRYKPFFSSRLRTKRLDRDAHYLLPRPCYPPPGTDGDPSVRISKDRSALAKRSSPNHGSKGWTEPRGPTSLWDMELSQQAWENSRTSLSHGVSKN